MMLRMMGHRLPWFYIYMLVCSQASELRSQVAITAMEWDRAGQMIILGSQQGVESRSLLNPRQTAHLPTQLAHIHDLSFAAEGTLLCAAGGTPGESGVIELYAWPTGGLIQRRRVAGDVVVRCRAADNGQQWLLVSADATAQVLNRDFEVLVDYRGHTRSLTAATYLTRGVVASAGVEGVIHVWSTSDGQSLRSLEGHEGTVLDLASRPNEVSSERLVEMVSIGTDGTVRLWQPLIGRLVRFVRLVSPPSCVRWNAAGDSIVVGCTDGSIHWLDHQDLRTQRTIQTNHQPLYELLMIHETAWYK